MKEVYYKSREEAQAAIDKHIATFDKKHPPETRTVYDTFYPKQLYIFPHGELEISIWNGMRMFKDCDWSSYSHIAANKDHTRIHLSEYWGDNEAGFYTKDL